MGRRLDGLQGQGRFFQWHDASQWGTGPDESAHDPYPVYQLAPVSAVAVVNAFYNPYLCGYTVNWAATNGLRVYDPPVSRALLETMINSLDVSDFNGTAKELPREVAR